MTKEMAMSSNISKKFSIGDTVFYILNTTLYQGKISQVSIVQTNDNTSISYNVGTIAPIDEKVLFGTAQLAVDAFSQTILDAFES